MTRGTWRKFDDPGGLFLIRSWEADPAIDRRQHHQAHLAWLDEGHESGQILLSGPSRDRSLGLYLVQAESAEDAREYVSSDPYHEVGIRSFEVTEWEIQRRTTISGLVADRAAEPEAPQESSPQTTGR